MTQAQTGQGKNKYTRNYNDNQRSIKDYDKQNKTKKNRAGGTREKLKIFDYYCSTK
jgi:hypothetical protein